MHKVEGIIDFDVDIRFMVAIRERVNLARKIDLRQKQKKKESANADWFRRAAEESDMILDESILRSIGDVQGQRRGKKKGNRDKNLERTKMRANAELKAWRAQLQYMLTRPLVRGNVQRGYF